MQELADLFQARSRFVEALAEVEDPLGRARDVLAGLPEEQRVEALAHHPRIGEREAGRVAPPPSRARPPRRIPRSWPSSPS